jgi:hypothetical protein
MDTSVAAKGKVGHVTSSAFQSFSADKIFYQTDELMKTTGPLGNLSNAVRRQVP